MKNKLEKTGHKKGYYRARRILSLSLFCFVGLSLAAIPVGISYKIAETQAAALSSNAKEEGEKDPEKSGQEKGNEEPALDQQSEK